MECLKEYEIFILIVIFYMKRIFKHIIYYKLKIRGGFQWDYTIILAGIKKLIKLMKM